MGNGILILFLSDYKADAKERIYKVENCQDSFTGCQTNDAPVKYLLHNALEQGDRIEKIIFIMSSKVKEDGGDKKFIKRVETYIQEDEKLKHIYETKIPDFESVDYNEWEMDTKIRTQKVYHEFARKLTKEENASMYIDYTGGLRDIAFFMIVIMRYMEYHNIQCKKIVYCNFMAGMIQSIDIIYDMFYLINGVDQFVRTGNAKVLAACYKRELDSDIKEVLQKLIQFSNAISLCDIRNIDLILPEISKGLENYEKRENANSLLAEIFNDLIVIVRQKMYIQEKQDFSYPQLIHWCLDNNMVQQALTLYIEKMPKYYYDKGLLVLPETEPKSLLPGYTRESDAFYNGLFTERINDDFNDFLNALNEINTQKNIAIELQRAGNHLNKRAKNAVNKIISFLHKYYNSNGKWSGRNPEKSLQDIFVPMKKTDLKFFHDILHNRTAQNYFFYGESKKSKDMGTYEKKLRILEFIKNGQYVISESRVEYQKLYEMMKYYCVLKIIRNRINHASEMENTKDENRAIEILETNHNVCMDITFENVKSLMYDGLKAHE